jgi:hypothetical protein
VLQEDVEAKIPDSAIPIPLHLSDFCFIIPKQSIFKHYKRRAQSQALAGKDEGGTVSRASCTIFFFGLPHHTEILRLAHLQEVSVREEQGDPGQQMSEHGL